FVSYNTRPGWRTLSALRDMLLYHTRETADPQVKTARARGLLDFLTQEMPKRNVTTAGLLKSYTEFFNQELQRLGGAEEGYVAHELLEAVNGPVYFSEFMARAGRHDLQFVTEFDFRTSQTNTLEPSLANGLMNVARDVIEWEQYVDFIKGRTFRMTLLCHDGVRVSRTMKPEVLMNLYLASSAKPITEVENNSVAVKIFGDPDGVSLSTDHPVTKETLTYLAEIWPRSVPFAAAFDEARARLHLAAQGDDRSALDARMLGNNLLTAFTYSPRLVELSVFSPRFVTEVSERPMASPWARVQGQDSFRVTNLRHESVELDAIQGYLLPYVDGTRDRAALLYALMVGPVAAGKMTVKHQDVPLQDPVQIRDVLAPEIEEALKRTARLALLVA
ncbi:MAG: methyltransferase regulatory domain-containing protein, partial [Chloroflexi bacterium]|nr:methyltransferase regulatory domain-containing protein [Chloroflexota bacterium]